MSYKPITQPVTLRSIISILLFQAIFYAIIVAIAYWILTLNWPMLAICTLISILQLFIQGTSDKYLLFVVNYLRPQDYFHI